MGRYIDAEELINDLLKSTPIDWNNYISDVEEVVRCKDCQYAKPHNCEFWIAEAPLLCELFDFYVSDNDYCSMGERKDG